jgi:Putative zinc-finger
VTESESNSLRRELAAIAPVGEHPDADVLTAFAEDSLLERERAAVLAHLAGCTECRQVLSLSVEAAPPGVVSITSSPRRVRNRVWMPWGAVAAGIAVACSIAVYRVEKRPVYAPTVTQKPESPAVAPPQEVAQVQAPASQAAIARRKDAPAPLTKTQSTMPAVSGNAIAQNDKQTTADALQQAEVTTDAEPAAKAKAEAAAPSRDLRSVTQSAGAIALSDAHAVSRNAPIARPHWRLNEQGQPERSFGDGTWLVAAPDTPARMHVVSIIGDVVWVGGDESQVFRSLNDGATWQPIALPAKNRNEHTIIHIRFEGVLTGTIEAADGTIWQTSDGGNTWR